MFDRVAAIAAESARIAELAATTAGAARVPGCPEWGFVDLVAHIGEVQRFWAANIEAANPDAHWGGKQEPPDGSDLAGWMAASTERLIAAVRTAPDSSPCWTWWGEPRTAGAVVRHQVQEAAVHRWDAESVSGAPAPLAPGVADDGVAEFLAIMVGEAASGLVGEITLRSVDTAGEWKIGDPSKPARALIRATASDLVLLLYRRLTVNAVDTDGDRDLVDSFVLICESE